MTPHKILLVDDEPNLARIVGLRLKDSGYQVVTAHDGEEAVNKVKKEKPNLVILDLMLPKLNGYEVAAKLKDDKQYADIPIVMLTACADIDDIKAGLQGSVSAYVTKPFKAEVLLGIIQGLLGKQ